MVNFRNSLWLLFLLGAIGASFADSLSNQDRVNQKLRAIRNELQTEKSNKTGTYTSEQKIQPVNTAWQIIQIGVGLGGVVLLVVVSMRGLKKLQGSSWLKSRGQRHGNIEVVDTCFVGKEQKILWIRAGGKEGLVGVATGGISWLQNLGEEPHQKSDVQYHEHKQVVESNPPAFQAQPLKATSAGAKEPTLRQDFSATLEQYLERFKSPKSLNRSSNEEA